MNKLLNVYRSAYSNLSGKRIFTLLLLLMPVLTFASGHEFNGIEDIVATVAMFIMALICWLTFALTRSYHKSQSERLVVILVALNLLLLCVSVSVLRDVMSDDISDWAEDLSPEMHNYILLGSLIPIAIVFYFVWVLLRKRDIV